LAQVALLVEKMRPTIAFPGEDVVEEDRFGREMYFVSDGLLELVLGHRVRASAAATLAAMTWAQWRRAVRVRRLARTLRMSSLRWIACMLNESQARGWKPATHAPG
jgi:hypothetical protein